MNAKDFQVVLDDQIRRIQEMLGNKRNEYADNADCLSNFRAYGALQKIPPKGALTSLMAKHTVSIYGMVESGKTFPLDVWDEKITDHIVYLILLRALLVEEDKEDAALGTGSTI